MRKLILIAVIAVLAASPAVAKTPQPTALPANVQALLACRGIADSSQRLACYDRESGAVAQAVERKDLVVIDRAQATAAKKSVFGFSVPDFAGLLGGGDIQQIEGKVAGVSQNADGGWVIKLDDGSVWSQTDDTPVALEPRRGDRVVVRRGTLGSYFLKLGSQPGFKAKRIG